MTDEKSSHQVKESSFNLKWYVLSMSHHRCITSIEILSKYYLEEIWLYIYIDIGKWKLYKNSKRSTPMYTWCIPLSPNSTKKDRENKNSLPLSDLNQSIKSIKDIEVCSINKFVQGNKDIKEIWYLNTILYTFMRQ